MKKNKTPKIKTVLKGNVKLPPGDYTVRNQRVTVNKKTNTVTITLDCIEPVAPNVDPC